MGASTRGGASRTSPTPVRLYHAVTILVDAAYRDQFVDTLNEQLRDTFERRSDYLDLLRRRGSR